MMQTALTAAAVMQAVEPADAASPLTADDIVVTAPGKPFRIEVDLLRRGQAAFAKDRARYAPQSSLHFRLAPRAGGTLAGFALAATEGHASIPVPIAADGDILLPTLPAGDWTLIGNRNGAGVRLRVIVLSPSTSEADRRLGDLRLQCWVGWAVIRPLVPFVLRAAFDAAGGCNSSHVAIYEGTGRSIGSAVAWRGTAAIPLRLGRTGTSYRMPLADRSLDDDARIRIAFR